MNVTEPLLPPIDDFVESIKEIWDSKWLTNNGQFHQELEAKLAEYLGVPYISLFNNGTIALISALQAMDLSGEVITTPYSFVATTHALQWNNLVPVFCDIDPHNFNIDPGKIEALITPQTTAILAVHCYGYPCDVDKIEEIAARHDLKVVYDAAHAFGVHSNGRSILNYGDLSVLSFHATKVFNTIEGGAIISHDVVTKARIDRLKNFGLADETSVVETGLNGKMNELQAAFGIHQLKYIDEALEKRRAADEYYRARFAGIEGIHVPHPLSHFSRNGSYFPILVRKSAKARDLLHARLRQEGINARRYFYPLISDMPMYSSLPSADPGLLPVARALSDRVLCLPLHPNLSIVDLNRVCNAVTETVEGNPEFTVTSDDELGNRISIPSSKAKEWNFAVPADPDRFSLSVVIPVYKAEEYLEKCLDSVLVSDEIPIEVIAVNDGSPDSSHEILARYAEMHPNLRVITQENRGGASAINRGLMLARNKYVMILDCDDWLEDNAIAIFKEAADASQAEVLAGKIVKIYKNKSEAAYDTDYIKQDEDVSITAKPSLFQDGMYLGKIFLRDLIIRERLMMDPTLLYADRPFVAVAIAQASKVRLLANDVYYWRQRENPANPSLTDQMHLDENLRDRVRSIRVIRDELKARQKQSLINVIDTYNLKRLFWHFKKKTPAALKSFAEICRPYIRDVEISRNKNLTAYQRGLANLIFDNPPSLFPAAYYGWFLRRKIRQLSPKKIANLFKDRLNDTSRKIGRAVHGGQLERITRAESPDQLLVVFESFFGKSYGGQPRYIYEELLKSGRAFRAVWVYQGKHKLKGIPGNVVQVHRGTREYFQYLARARYWVNNIRFTVTYKPPHTTYLQTWHGTPLKRLGLDIDVSGPEASARDNFLAEARNWDYLLAANQFSEERFRSAFGFRGRYLTGGYPANDVFMQPQALQDLVAQTRADLNIPADKRVILYAPTWRDDQAVNNSWAYRFDLKLNLRKMKAELGSDHVLLLRMHHLIADQINLRDVEDFALDVSKYDDPAGLMAISDVLISDYSSIFFDFANLNRPMIFYMYDLQKYSSNLRGFYFDPEDILPGPIVENFADLMTELKKGDAVSEEYSEKMDQFRQKFCELEDGTSAKRIVNEVFAELPFLDGGRAE